MNEQTDRATRAPSMAKRRGAALLAAGTVVGGILAGGVAWATIPGPDGVISTCYLKSGGTLRVIDATTGKCSSKETSLSWNVQGPPGPAGEDGQDGQDGAPGADGVSGYEIVEDSGQDNGIGGVAHTHSVFCPANKVPTGGGGSANIFKPSTGFPAAIRGSVLTKPEGDGVLYGWEVTFGDFDGTAISSGETLQWRVSVVCVNETEATS